MTEFLEKIFWKSNDNSSILLFYFYFSYTFDLESVKCQLYDKLSFMLYILSKPPLYCSFWPKIFTTSSGHTLVCKTHEKSTKFETDSVPFRRTNHWNYALRTLERIGTDWGLAANRSSNPRKSWYDSWWQWLLKRSEVGISFIDLMQLLYTIITLIMQFHTVHCAVGTIPGFIIQSAAIFLELLMIYGNFRE